MQQRFNFTSHFNLLILLLEATSRNIALTIFVCTLLFSTVPSAPSFAGTCEANNKTAEICVSWLKPVGGNEIDNYIVQWTIIEDNVEHSEVIPFYWMETNTYTISNIEPAQSVNVSIRVINFAGESETSWQVYATGKSFLVITFYLAYLVIAISVRLYFTL